MDLPLMGGLWERDVVEGLPRPFNTRLLRSRNFKIGRLGKLFQL
jgi:hypothetical protein